MSKSIEYSDIKIYINSLYTGNGCLLLTTKDEFEFEKIKQNKSNVLVKLKIQCGCKDKNIFFTSFDKFKSRNKKQCNECGKNIRINKKKLSFEYVKYFIEVESKSGCELISKEYNGIFENLQIQCKCGNCFHVSFDSFKYGNVRRCLECYKQSIREEKTLSYSEVKNFIEIESNSGCILISKEYIHSQEKLKIKCICGTDFITSFINFKYQHKRHCDKCGVENRCNKLKKPYKEVKKFIEITSESGCKLISNEYISVKNNLKLKCKCGEEFEASFENFLRTNKRQCNKCGNRIKIESLKIPYEQIKEVIEGENGNGCKLLTNKDDYINTNELIQIQCLCGNPFITTFDNFKHQNKKQCNECSQKLKKIFCLNKYGVENPMQNKEISSKVRNTLYKNGTVPCSNQQEYIYNIIGGELNYPYFNASLDIAFPNEKLYVECDFGGHWLSIKLGTTTEKEFKQKERNRWYSLYRAGWKEIRIISKKDNIPQDNKILEMISYAKQYLSSGHHYIKFDIDNSKVINSQGEFDYDFGELRRIKESDLQKAI